MDLASIDEKLVAGEALKIKYRYPVEDAGRGSRFGVRTDKLLDVSLDLERFYTKFRGDEPIWVSADEMIEIVPDDGVYEELPGE